VPFTRYLTTEEVEEVSNFFDLPNVSYDSGTRAILRANLAGAYRSRMQDFPQPAAQLAADLDFLNTSERLADGTVPLRVWLQNAAEHFSDETAAVVFRKTLEVLERRVAEGGVAAPPEPPRTGHLDSILRTVWLTIQEDGEARDAVNFYREIFRQALQEIDVITGYKDMHESLHNLKMGWPPDVVALAATLPDPNAQLRLSNLVMFLGGIVDGLKKTLARENVRPAPLKFIRAANGDGGLTWVEELERCHAGFDLAVGEVDGGRIVAVSDTINTNIGPLLSGLNTQLKEAVEVMRLGRLIEARRRVCGVLLRLDPQRTAEKVTSYQKGIDQLVDLDAGLRTLKEQHDEWQRVDDRLTSFDDLIALAPQKLETLDLIYKMLKTTVEPLYEASGEKWAVNLLMAVRNLREALDKQDENKAKAWFQFYRETAKLRFFELDRQMMAQCRKLSEVGGRLREIDGELENM
jgi:hypothetical protein